MQCLLILVSSFLVYNYYAEGAVIETADGSKRSFLSRIKQLIENKCLQNANRSAYEDAVEKLDHFVDCWYVTLPRRRICGDEMYKYCMEESKNFTTRLNIFLEKLTPCLDPQEHYLKAIILHGSKKHDHYFCKALSCETRDRLTRCVADLKISSEDNFLTACFENSYTFSLASSSGNVITKEELCNDLLNIDRCCETEFDKRCTDSRGIKEIFLDVIKYAIENCHKSM